MQYEIRGRTVSITYIHVHVVLNLPRLIIRPCHTAAILSREIKKALFYHAKPRSGNHGGEDWRGKTKLFCLPGQYGRRVTWAN